MMLNPDVDGYTEALNPLKLHRKTKKNTHWKPKQC